MAATSYKTLHRRAQFLYQLGRDLDGMSPQLDPSRVVRVGLRRLGEALDADVAVQVDVRRSDRALYPPYRLGLTPRGRKLLLASPPGTPDDPAGPKLIEACRRFLRMESGSTERDLLLLRVAIPDRPVAVLAFRRPGRAFSRGDAGLAESAAELVSESLIHRDRERAAALKERIYAKLAAQLRPKDVLYQILHGLEQLLEYDHGAAVLLFGSPAENSLVVQAEVVTHTKAKSLRIGRAFTLSPEDTDWLRLETRVVCVKHGAPDPRGPKMPTGLLDALLAREPDAPPARAALFAPLRRGRKPLGLLQVLATSDAAFRAEDVTLLASFLPLAAAAVYNSEMVTTQHERLVSAERRVALADLARAISHDLNNAFGVMLPLVQTLRRDVDDGVVSPEQAARDLGVLEHYVQFSGRIFKGLLSVARGESEEPRWIDLTALLEQVLFMLRPNLDSLGIQVESDLAADTPTVFARRGELEQLVLNLVYNARDSMSTGGVLRLSTRPDGEGVRLEVSDTGAGIPPELKARIFEPFFTTKPTGSGLGLDICRSIVWDYEGKLELTAAPERGTTAVVWLPRTGARTVTR